MAFAVPAQSSSTIGPARQAHPTIHQLASLSHGKLASVKEVHADADDAVRLKSLGICVGRRVQVVKTGDPLVVRVLGARVGLSARLAEQVSVESV